MVGRVSGTRQRRRTGGLNSASFVVLALGIAAVAYMAGQRQPSHLAPGPVQRAFVSEFDTVQVPVPDRPVLAGTLVRDIPVRMESFAEHQIPRGAVRDLGLYRDAVVLAALPGGLPIPESNIGQAEDATNPVVGKIPPGMRAMAVRVDATASVEGWARSGSVVDVLLVEKNRTIVVAEKVRVLSTENSVSPVNEQSNSPTPSTVTLLVTQEQCLAINTAAPMGKIAFALRGTRDGESWKSTEFSSTDLSGDAKGERAQLKIAGMATFKRGDKDQKFALVDGTWIPAESAEGSSGRKARVGGAP